MAAKGNDLRTLMEGGKNKHYKEMVKRVEFYKKCTSSFATLLMATCMLYTLPVLGYNFY